MSVTRSDLRSLEPGTSGWTASDLDDPQVAWLWDAGRFEIIDGILKTMPPADFDHGEVALELLTLTRSHLRGSGVAARISMEVDLIRRLWNPQLLARRRPAPVARLPCPGRRPLPRRRRRAR